MVAVVKFTPTLADKVGVVDPHVIPGNLSPAQPVVTSQLSDSDSSGTLFYVSLAICLTVTVIYLCPHQSLVQLQNCMAQKPGHYIRFEGRHGETYNPSYSDILIPVLHHGAVCGGVDKCDLCYFHLQGNCRWGSCCTYAHSWAERIEWICPICKVDGRLDCD